MAQVQNTPYFVSDESRRNSLETGRPVISEGLNSVRAYQFEIHFELPPALDPDTNQSLTLAAKQVSQVGMTVEDIEVNRLNDKVFYPGKASPEELQVTFDNLYQPKVANTLWEWFSTIYDPTNGKYFTESANTSPDSVNMNNWKSQRFTIVYLDPQGQPLMETRLFGAYPKSWKTAELNYSTNDFHTIEMGFRYDFIEHVTFGEPAGSALRSA